MNYMGSKKRLASWVLDNSREVLLAEKILTDVNEKIPTFVDLFAGTGQISQAFIPFSEKIIMNDFQNFTYDYLQRFNITETDMTTARIMGNEIILNGIIQDNKEESPFYDWYAGKYFTNDNTKKIIILNDFLHSPTGLGLLESKSKPLWLAMKCMLLEAADKVQNCSSNYSAYLKKIKPSAEKDLVLREVPCYGDINNVEFSILNKDSDLLIENLKGDVLYMDPPYNARQYWTNYHILNTISSWDLNFQPEGKTMLPPMKLRKNSDWSYARKVFRSFTKSLDSKFKMTILSYNDEGLIPTEIIMQEMKQRGKYVLIEKDYNKFKSNKNVERSVVKEQLHILIK